MTLLSRRAPRKDYKAMHEGVGIEERQHNRALQSEHGIDNNRFEESDGDQAKSNEYDLSEVQRLREEFDVLEKEEDSLLKQRQEVEELRQRIKAKRARCRNFEVEPQIKARLMQCGSVMIGYQTDGEYVNFFRMIQSNFDTSTEDMDFLLEKIS